MVYVCVCVGGAVDVGSAAFSVSSALVLIKLCASRSVGRGSGPPSVPTARTATPSTYGPPVRTTSPKVCTAKKVLKTHRK